MNAYLKIVFADPMRQNEYPNDNDDQEFLSLQDFIEFCITECEEVASYAPDYKKVADKLRAGDFTVDSADSTRVTVYDI